MHINLKDRAILRDLGDGLALCRSRAEDAEAVAEFNSKIHSDNGMDQPDAGVADWTRDLLARPHPTLKPDDFTLVVETSSGRLISSSNLISQTWAYEGIPFKVGRPELVGTLPDFRGRGLVRVQMDEIHKWSAERGEVVQAITGIPYYYRIFGYEMAMELEGGRAGYEAQLPKLKDGESEAFLFRPAALEDIPFLMEVYAYESQRSMVSTVRDESIWRYELTDQSAGNVNRLVTFVIERADSQEPVGYIRHTSQPWEFGLAAYDFQLKPGVSWLAVSPAAARFLWQRGEVLMQAQKKRGTTFFGFWLGSEHPVYEALRDRLPRVRPPYAWYIRIPDLAGFIRHIGPALEKRLAESIAVGHTGKLRINRYRTVLALSFENGKLVDVDESPRDSSDYADLGLPGLTILQLVFGYRSFDELRAAFPDVYVDKDEQRALLEALFPKKCARLIPIA